MAQCKGCGKSILFIQVGESLIPVDPTPPVYSVWATVENTFKGARAPQNLNGDGPAYLVSHFATCPQANRFSRSNHRPVTQGGSPS